MVNTAHPGRPAVVSCVFCATANRVDLARAAAGPKCGSCGRPIRLDRPLPVTDADFQRTITGASVPVVVDFHADWCGPCKMMAPVLDDFARRHMGDVLVLKLDTDANPATSARLGIRGIPTLIVFHEGGERGRHVGLAQLGQVERLAGVAESESGG